MKNCPLQHMACKEVPATLKEIRSSPKEFGPLLREHDKARSPQQYSDLIFFVIFFILLPLKTKMKLKTNLKIKMNTNEFIENIIDKYLG